MGNLLELLHFAGHGKDDDTEPALLLKCCTVENSWLEISYQNDVTANIRGSWISLNIVVSTAQSDHGGTASGSLEQCTMPNTTQEHSNVNMESVSSTCSLNPEATDKLEMADEIHPIMPAVQGKGAEHQEVKSLTGATSIDLQTDTDRYSFCGGTSSKEDNSSAEMFVTPRRSRCSSSLSLSTSLYSPREAKRRVIADVLQRRIAALVDKLNPEKVSQQLYAIAVFDDGDVERANDQNVSRTERANNLVLLVIRKLRARPEWFEDVCTVLSKAGVCAIEEAKAEVEKRCPDESSFCSEEMLEEEVSSILSTLERYYKTNGIESAKEFLQSCSENNPQLPLVHGACKGDVDICILNFLLTETDCDVNSKDKHGCTPLHVVCASLEKPASSSAESVLQEKQKRMKLENLLKHGADCTLQDKDGNTALHLSTVSKDVNVVRMLLSYSPHCVNIVNKLGNTAIHITCKEGLVDIAQLLCHHKPNVATRNEEESKTPLHYAASLDTPVLVALLLKCDHGREYVDAQDKNGDTALHIASRNGSKKIVQELLSRKANKNLTNLEGKTPAQVAIDGDHNKAAEVLLRKRRWLKGSGKKAVKKLKRSATQASVVSYSDESGDDDTIVDEH